MKKEKGTLLRNTGLKVTAAILVLIFAAIAVAGGVAAAFMISQNIYFTPQETIRDRQFRDLSVGTASMVLAYWRESNVNQDAVDWNSVFEQTNVIGISIETSEGTGMKWGNTTDGTTYRCFFEYGEGEYGPIQSPLYIENNEAPLVFHQVQTSRHEAAIEITIDSVLKETDNYYWADQMILTAYAFQYWVFVITIAALIGAIWCFVFLIRSAGCKQGVEGLHIWPTTKIPGDLWYGAAGLLLFLLVQIVYEGSCYGGGSIFLILGIPGIFYFVLFLCMDLAIRCKAGGFWKHTLFYWLGVRLVRGIRKTGKLLRALFKNLPLIWKTALIYAGISFLNLILLLFNYGEMDNLVIIWCVENLLLFPAVLAAALMMRKLLAAGKTLASGDMSSQVDTSRLILDFKTHGENLNHIGEGMTVAVEERMKSERMKTALITNVSHDIKTPLTSIINYSDLICSGNCDSDQITQYAQVLHRQSEKLKRLIEDLVEASKASTGNMEINLAPCEVGVILTQAVGEYEEKLQEANLELITKKPNTPVTIMADSRRLWRIFDNLMINISKYAQPGTRVYLTLEEEDGNARISFKNISRAVLDISPDELMERFVRGDSSRNSEGNGLGLSITKSLTELQGGTMNVSIDGDLFKVVLSFPKKDM